MFNRRMGFLCLAQHQSDSVALISARDARSKSFGIHEYTGRANAYDRTQLIVSLCVCVRVCPHARLCIRFGLCTMCDGKTADRRAYRLIHRARTQWLNNSVAGLWKRGIIQYARWVRVRSDVYNQTGDNTMQSNATTRWIARALFLSLYANKTNKIENVTNAAAIDNEANEAHGHTANVSYKQTGGTALFFLFLSCPSASLLSHSNHRCEHMLARMCALVYVLCLPVFLRCVYTRQVLSVPTPLRHFSSLLIVVATSCVHVTLRFARTFFLLRHQNLRLFDSVVYIFLFYYLNGIQFIQIYWNSFFINQNLSGAFFQHFQQTNSVLLRSFGVEKKIFCSFSLTVIEK